LKKLSEKDLVVIKTKRNGAIGHPERRINLSKKGKNVFRIANLLEEALTRSQQ
jgi:hypothetical protein